MSLFGNRGKILNVEFDKSMNKLLKAISKDYNVDIISQKDEGLYTFVNGIDNPAVLFKVVDEDADAFCMILTNLDDLADIQKDLEKVGLNEIQYCSKICDNMFHTIAYDPELQSFYFQITVLDNIWKNVQSMEVIWDIFQNVQILYNHAKKRILER